MRVAFLTFEYPDVRPGGIGSYVYRCALSLAAAGHEAHVFTLPVPASLRESLPRGFHLHTVPDIAEKIADGSLPGPVGALALNSELAGYKLAIGALLSTAVRHQHCKTPFDVVEAAEYEALSLPLMLKPIKGLPIITQIQLGSSVNSFGNDVPVESTDHLAEALELATILGADAVYAATQSVVDVTRRVSPFTRDVPIIPYPVELSPRLTPTPKNGAVLFVGRLQKRKGCDVFASAASQFLQQNPDATVRVAGADTNTAPGATSMWHEMQRRIDRKVQSRFHFLGELPHEQVREEINRCRFQVIPSVVENFANTAIDAFAAGRMVIYGGNTGLDDVVADAGIRVWPLTPENLAAKMNEAWRDEKLIATYEHRGVARVRAQFASDEVTARRISFYEGVVAASKRGPAVHPFERFNGMTASQFGCVLNAFSNVLHTCVGVEDFVSTPGRRLMTHLEALEKKLARRPVVWLFGAGRHTTRLMGERYLWESRGITLAGVIDDHRRFKGTATYLGLPLRSSQKMRDALKQGDQVDSIVLSTDTLQKLFREQTTAFRDAGVETPQLF